MDQNQKCSPSLLLQVEAYGKNSVEILKLKLTMKVSKMVSKFVTNYIILCLFSMFLIWFSAAVSIWLGDYIGKMSYGFFCVAGFYGLCVLVMYFVIPKWMIGKVRNSIITEMLN